MDELKRPRLLPVKPDRVGRSTNQTLFLNNLVKAMMSKHSTGAAFAKVDAMRQRVPEYYNVIKKPMDLETISLRLQNEYYE